MFCEWKNEMVLLKTDFSNFIFSIFKSKVEIRNKIIKQTIYPKLLFQIFKIKYMAKGCWKARRWHLFV